MDANTKIDTIPDHVPPEVVFELDHFNLPGAEDNPFDTYLEINKKTPDLFYSPYYGGFWVPTRYETIRYILTTPEIFSSYPMNFAFPNPWPRKLIPVELDPPEHPRYRRILAPLFTAKALEPYAAELEANANRLVDGFIDKGRIEFLSEFARPFPLSAFLSLMGLPQEDLDMLQKLEETILHSMEEDRRMAAGMEVVQYLVQEFEQARNRPHDANRLMSHLVYYRNDQGEPLTQDELIDTGFLLFMAGLDTVTSVFGYAFAWLANHPEVKQSLMDDPDRINPTLEEICRLHPTVNTNRTVLKDTELEGQMIKQGEHVLLPMVFANHDPDVFEDPESVKLDRKTNPHMLFGSGPHTCLGNNLARREMRLAMEIFLKRIPDFHIPEDARVINHAGAIMGTQELTLAWDPKQVNA